jgi:hypothetical protein
MNACTARCPYGEEGLDYAGGRYMRISGIYAVMLVYTEIKDEFGTLSKLMYQVPSLWYEGLA